MLLKEGSFYFEVCIDENDIGIRNCMLSFQFCMVFSRVMQLFELCVPETSKCQQHGKSELI